MMYLFRLTIIAAVLLAVFPLTTHSAKAETSIAVVDVRALMNDSKAAKSIQKQVNDKRDSFLEELGKEEQKLRDQEQELTKLQTSADKETFAAKLKSFEADKLKTRQMVQEKKRKLEESLAGATNELQTQIYKVVEKIAADRNIEMVVTRQNVVVVSKEMDITDDAMKELNKALSSVKLK